MTATARSRPGSPARVEVRRPDVGRNERGDPYVARRPQLAGETHVLAGVDSP